MIDKIVVHMLRLVSSPVYAAWPPKLDELTTKLDELLDKILPFGALLAVGMIVFGGYMWIVSGGEPSRKQLAQGTLTWAVLGLVFLFLVKTILSVIAGLFF